MLYESPLVDESLGSLTGVVTGFLTSGSWAATAPATTGPVPDGCGVPTEPLSRIVRGFVSTWNQDRPQTAGRFHADDDDPLTPVRATAWLSENSGVPEAEISLIMARRRRPRITELWIADALVTKALEREDYFYDGDPPTLPILPNPDASLEARHSCCGGSEWSLDGSGSW